MASTSTTPRWANVGTIALIVGETKTVFHVHEADLLEASPFFKSAITSDLRKTSERTMSLPEDDESTFELFVDWLYRQRYEIPSRPKDASEDYDRFLQSIKLFVLADKYDVRSLKSLIVSRIFLAIKRDADVPDLPTITYAYEHTSHNSAIRKLLVDILVCNVDLSWYQDDKTKKWLMGHGEISTDLNIRFATQTLKRKNPFAGRMPDEYVEDETEN